MTTMLGHLSVTQGQSLVVDIVAILVAYQTVLIVYRTYFHPLSTFPGPKVFAASRWCEFWYDVWTRGLYNFKVRQMHEKYGSIVRVAPNEVHIDDPGWSRTLLAGPGYIRDKDPSLAASAGSPSGTFGTSSHHAHRFRRAPIANFYSQHNVQAMQGRMHDTAEKLCQRLYESYTDGLVVQTRYTFLAWATDSLTKCSFSESFGLLDDVNQAVAHFNVFHAFGRLYPLLKQWSWIIPTALKAPIAPFRIIFPPLATILEVHINMHAFAKRVYEEETQLTEKDTNRGPNVFRSIIKSDMLEEEKLPERISHEGLETLLAGSYTSSRALQLVTFHVLNDVIIHRRLKEELVAAMPKPSDNLDVQALQELPYLNSIVREALRLGNITNHRLALIMDKPFQYKDCIIPAGARISTTPSANGLDPAYFSDPYRFAPERWLQSSEERLREMNRVYLPFAAGSRGCIGMRFATAELHIVIAKMFRRFDLELYDTTRERDIDDSWTHLVGEPAHGSKHLQLLVKGCDT